MFYFNNLDLNNINAEGAKHLLEYCCWSMEQIWLGNILLI